MKNINLMMTAVLLFNIFNATSLVFAYGLHETDTSQIVKTASYTSMTESEMLQRKSRCSPGSYFGPVSPDSEAVYTNCDGKILHGRLDAYGNGYLKDEQGVTIVVVPVSQTLYNNR